MSSKFKQAFQKYSQKVKSALTTEKKEDQDKQETTKQTKLKQTFIWKNPQKINGKGLNNIDGFFYLTERIIMAPFPNGETIEELSEYLNEYHKDQYIVYNLSEHKYDIAYFDNSVMEYSYPGLPSAPLDVIFMICISMVSWLHIDPKNIIVIHCQGTKGRSALIASCFLAFNYYKEFDGPKDTFQYFCKIANLNPSMLLYPSQDRYLDYFGEVLNGFIPLNKPLILQRIIMYGIPEMQDENQVEEELKSDDEHLNKFSEFDPNAKILCAPYFQLFKNGKMMHSTLQDKKLPNFYYAKDQCAIFDIGQRVENDFLIRCRHYKSSSQRISMFRAAIHTSFIVDNVLRLTRDDLDGACENYQYPNDFFLDLIFVDARNQTNTNFKTPNKDYESTGNTKVVNKQQVIEEERKVDIIGDPEQEEQKLMQGEKNIENKDDFWISIWDQIQNRDNDQQEQKSNPTQVNSTQLLTKTKEEFKMNLKQSPENLIKKGRKSSVSNQSLENKSQGNSSPASSNDIKWDQSDENDQKSIENSVGKDTSENSKEEATTYHKQLTHEEKEKINQIISSKDEEKSNHDSDNDVDDYLDNLENDSD